MKVADAHAAGVSAGDRILVIGVAHDEAEARGYVNDAERLLGQTGTVERCEGGTLGQLIVDWDNELPGSLMLAHHDEVAVLKTAWDLIGEVGDFRIAGGKAVYEEVNYEDRQRGSKVKLQRIDAWDLHTITRYVDGDTPIEVLALFA